jgi:hypothetical protein
MTSRTAQLDGVWVVEMREGGRGRRALTHLFGGGLQSMPRGSGEVPSWRCFGGLGAFLRAPAPDDDDDVAIAAARRRPRGTVVVGSGRTNLLRRRADDSSLPLLGSRLEGADEARGS